MSMESIIEILKIVGYIILGGAALYIKSRGNIVSDIASKVAAVIAEAEAEYKDVTKAGGQKFEFAVGKLYELVPAILKPVITKDLISQMVQSAFDGVETYSQTQIDKLAASIHDKREMQ